MPTMDDKQWRKYERDQRRKYKRERWASKTTSQKAATIWLITIFGLLAFLIAATLFGVLVACNLSDFRHAWPVDVALLIVIISWVAAGSLDR